MVFKLGDIVWMKKISRFAHVHKVQGNDYYIVMDSSNTTYLVHADDIELRHRVP